jgi:nitrogen regulatory protein PII
MNLHKAKRVEIIIEAPMQSRLTKALDAGGVSGYTVLPVLGGSGRSGPWSSEGQISLAGGMVHIVSIVTEDKVNAILEIAFDIVEKHLGIVSVSDCDIVRLERF